MSTYAAVRPKRPTATEVQRAESVGQLSGIKGLKSWTFPSWKEPRWYFFAEIFVATRNGSLQTIAIINNYRISTLNVLKFFCVSW